MNIKPWYVAVLPVLLLGCSNDAPPRPGDAAKGNGSVESGSIGPQFYKYDLDDYSVAEQDVVSGLGGRWISVRYDRKPDAGATKQQVTDRIVAALLNDGWERTKPPQRYTMAKLWNTASDDLCFQRKARGEEPPHWFFTQTIHISYDGSTLCVYAEVGW